MDEVETDAFAEKPNHIPVFDMAKINPCPPEPGYTLPANSVEPDQLASEEAS